MGEFAAPSTSDARLRDMVAREQQWRVRSIAGDTTATEGDDVLNVDTSGGNVTVTLPDASLGHAVFVRKAAAANTLTVAAKAGQTINGAATFAWAAQYASYHFIPVSKTEWGVFAYVPTASGTVTPSFVKLTSDVGPTSSTSPSNVTGLSLAVAANTDYRFEFDVLFQCVSTTGYGLAVTCPAGATISYAIAIPAGSASGDPDGDVEGVGASSGAVVVATSTPSPNTSHLARVRGILRNGANAGTLQVQHRSGLSGVNVTTKAGSCGLLYALT